MKFWQGLGSDRRYNPTWPWMRRAYLRGLEDAMKIVEEQAWATPVRPDPSYKKLIGAIYRRAQEFHDGDEEVRIGE